VHIGKRRRHEYIDTSEQVILRDTVVEPKLIEQACLIAGPASGLTAFGKAESLFVVNLKPFSTASVRIGKAHIENILSGIPR
jgi:hypothetical protein